MAQKEERGKPTRFKFREPARIVQWNLCPDYLDFDINLRNGKGNLIMSALSIKYGRAYGPKLQHFNETSPRDYLSMAIEDVIDCSGIPATVIIEATLFSLRPNLIVVVCEGRILFTVEIKNPASEDPSSVFTAETAAGQSLDHLKSEKQMGIDQPFALLSTYNESVIVCFNADHDAYEALLSKGARNAGEIPSKRHTSQPAEPKKPPVSPPKPNCLLLKLQSLSANKATEQSEESSPDLEDEDVGFVYDNNAMQSGEYDYMGREVRFSQKFGVENLYKALTLLLESSLVSAVESTESVKAFVPQDGSKLSGDLCTLTEDGFTWRCVSIEKVSYNVPPEFQKGQVFHPLCVLDQGGTGRSVLCCTSTGKMFAAKLFLIRTSLKYSEEERKRELDQQIREKTKLAEEERSKWLLLAPKECHKYCRVIKMNGVPALTMPFFPPIPFEQREGALGLIQERLTEFAKRGYFYSNSDLRWRQVGCR